MKIIDVSVGPMGVQVVTEERCSTDYNKNYQVTCSHSSWSELLVVAWRILPPLVGIWRLVSVDEKTFPGGSLLKQFSWKRS